MGAACRGGGVITRISRVGRTFRRGADCRFGVLSRDVSLNDEKCTFLNLQFRQNLRPCVYSLPRAPSLARCTLAQDVITKDYHTVLPLLQLRIIKDCRHILRWSLDGKERLQRREHLQSELRRGGAGGDRKHIGEGWGW